MSNLKQFNTARSWTIYSNKLVSYPDNSNILFTAGNGIINIESDINTNKNITVNGSKNITATSSTISALNLQVTNVSVDNNLDISNNVQINNELRLGNYNTSDVHITFKNTDSYDNKISYFGRYTDLSYNHFYLCDDDEANSYNTQKLLVNSLILQNTLDSNNVSNNEYLAFNNFPDTNSLIINNRIKDIQYHNGIDVDNTALGYDTLVTISSSQAKHNTAIGRLSLSSLDTGSNNTAVGSNSLSNIINGENNVALGSNCGAYLEGSNNVLIGNDAANHGPSYNASNMIVIGKNSNHHGSNKVVLGNTDTTAWEPDNNNVTLGNSSYRFLQTYTKDLNSSNNINVGNIDIHHYDYSGSDISGNSITYGKGQENQIYIFRGNDSLLGDYNLNAQLQNLDISQNLTILNNGELHGPSSFIIDPSTHGDNTGTVIIKGNLNVEGTQHIVNSTVVEISDVAITLAANLANTNDIATLSNGSGIDISNITHFRYVHNSGAAGGWNISGDLVYNNSTFNIKDGDNTYITLDRNYENIQFAQSTKFLGNTITLNNAATSIQIQNDQANSLTFKTVTGNSDYLVFDTSENRVNVEQDLHVETGKRLVIDINNTSYDVGKLFKYFFNLPTSNNGDFDAVVT